VAHVKTFSVLVLDHIPLVFKAGLQIYKFRLILKVGLVISDVIICSEVDLYIHVLCIKCTMWMHAGDCLSVRLFFYGFL
jgi:hypothetical protein